MRSQRSYKPRDFQSAQRLFALRQQTGLTQGAVARRIGVAEKTIRNWEGGNNYPSDTHLQKLIALYLDQHVFTPGNERDEAHALWEQFRANNPRLKFPFDEDWFAALLKAREEAHTNQALASEDHPLHLPVQTESIAQVTPSRLLQGDWSGAFDVASWYGRTDEFVQLERWVLQEQSRLVIVLGMGGIGKTTLVMKWMQQVASHFEYVLWRSLHNAPPLKEVLHNWLSILTEHHTTLLPQDEEQVMAYFIEQLQNHRCLLVLDNLETLFQEGKAGQPYQPGYESYARLIRYVAETTHQSCLVLTSRELSIDLMPLLHQRAHVRLLRLAGLTLSASQLLLQDHGLFGDPVASLELAQRYAGNPLALKIVAETVRELFGGDISTFLVERPASLIGIRQVLEQQFERLSVLEQEVLYWLAIVREPITLEILKNALRHPVARSEVIGTLHSLRSRCLIEHGETQATFALHPVILEYVTERFIAHMDEEIRKGQLMLFCRHGLLQGKAKEYVRASQVRLLLQPLLDRLLAYFGSQQEVEAQFDRLLQQLRTMPPMHQGYGGGNVVNLLIHLSGHLRGKDCSRLSIWQADLQETQAQDTNFAGSDLTDSVFLEPMENILSLTVSDDNQYLAGGSTHGQIYVWRLGEYQQLRGWTGHDYMIWTLAFIPESTMLVSGGYDGLVKVWEVSSGQCINILRGHTKWVRSVAAHPAGRLLVTCSDDGSIRLWDLTTANCIQIWHEQHREVWSVTFSPDGRLLASGDTQGTVKVWDFASGQHLWSASAFHSSTITSLAFSPNSELLVSGGIDGCISVWEVGSGDQQSRIFAHMDEIHTVTFNAEGLLASGSHDYTIKLWRIGPRGGYMQCLGTLYGHRDIVWSLAFAPNGLLASGGNEGTMKLWQINEDGKGGRCFKSLHGYADRINWIEFSPDGKILMSSDANGMVKIWEMASGQYLGNLTEQSGIIGSSAGGKFSPSGKLIIYSAHTPELAIKLWDVESRQQLKSLQGHRGEIWVLTFSPDGRFLVSGGYDTTIRLWEVNSGQCVATFRDHDNWIWALAFSPDGTLLASGDINGTIKLWEINSRQCIKTLQKGQYAILDLKFTPDGTKLLSSNTHDLVTIWDVENDDCVTTVSISEGFYWLSSVAFSPDGKLLAAQSEGTVKLWEVNSGELLHTFPHPTGSWSVAWSADGSVLGCGTNEGTIFLWEVQTGQCLATLCGDRPYERMNIHGATGITERLRTSLQALGAINQA